MSKLDDLLSAKDWTDADVLKEDLKELMLETYHAACKEPGMDLDASFAEKVNEL